MKRKVLFFGFLTLMLFNYASFSQEENLSIESLKSVSYVFKGSVVSSIPFKSDKENIWMMAYTIKIQNIYKGDDIKEGTIILITESVLGWSETEYGPIPNIVSEYTTEEKNKFAFGLGSGTTRMFFCNILKNNFSNLPKSNTDNSIVIEPLYKNRCYFGYYPDEKIINNKAVKNIRIKGFGKEFTTEDEFIEFLKENRLISETSKKKDVYLDNAFQNEILYTERVKNAQIRQQLLDERIRKSKIQVQTKEKANEGITFEITNQQPTNGNQYYEFDIVVNGSSSNTYIDNTAFVIQYNSIPFGTNIVANNNVTITRGTNYNTTTYIDPMTIMTDDSNNSIRFGIGSDYNAGSWNRPLLTPTPQILAHVKMKILNCTDASDLLFIDITNVSFVTLYTLTSTENPMNSFLQYDDVEYIQPASYALCPAPIVTNIYPNPITSGTNSILTIEGYNFGNVRDTGQIWMFADNGGSTLIKYFDYIDYLSWNDTEIKFIVPSNIDTLGQDTLGYGVGSGLITVRRSDGATGIYSAPVQVTYANMNVSIAKYTPSYQKIPVRVISDYLDTTKYFYLDTSITNDPAKEIAVTEALHHWSCASLINWQVKDTIELQHVEDGISVIYLNDSYHGKPLARASQSNGSVCTDTHGDKVAYYKDIDIGFTRDFTQVTATGWFIDTSYTQNLPSGLHDFYAVAQHELGHAHGIDHVNDNTDLMYYTISYGPTTYANRRDLYSSANAIYGGVYVLDKSGLMTSCGSISIMLPATAENCESNIGVSELFNNDIIIQAYPNPIDAILNIKYSLKRNSDISFSIYNFMGRNVN
ncbi:MAG: matrixin family metalloprotease, partial [Bacteroidales bacterium]|nr:matrixin family metalloprotease [Bacteroidales bacterium]